MSKSRAQSERIYKHVGKLVVSWNDLELQLRRLLYCLSPDWFTATVLTADMQASGLLHVVKTMAGEHDADATKLNRFMEDARPKTGHKVRPLDLVKEHVNRVVECADSLRLHRNYFAHGINSPTVKIPYFTLGGMTARKQRLAMYDRPIELAEIRRITALIGRTTRYAKQLESCIRANQRTLGKPPRWPQKLPVPEQPDKKAAHLNERIPLF